MNRYALIQNNKVVNVVEQESIPTIPGEWVLVTGAFGPGDNYVSGVFSKGASSAPKHITQLAFISRFTDAEAVAIDLASIGATTQAASIRRYLQKVNLAEYIDLNREDTIQGIQALEVAGLIGAGRASAILNAPIQEHEVYKARNTRGA